MRLFYHRIAIVLLVAGCNQTPVGPSATGDNLAWTTIDELPAGESATAVWGSGADDVYLAMGSTLRHFDGQTWDEVSAAGDVKYATAIWGSSATDVYVAAHYLRHFDGADWITTDVRADYVTGTGPSEVYVAGRQGVLHFDGTAWDTLLTFEDYRYAHSLWAGTGSLLMVVSDYPDPDSLWWWDSNAWTVSAAPGSVTGIWGEASDDLLAVGRDEGTGYGAIWRWNGVDWTSMPLPGQQQTIYGIDGSGWDNLYASTCCGTLFKYASGVWQPITLPTSRQLWRVWTSGPADVYVLGDRAGVFHEDGTGWERVFRLTPYRANVVWAESPARIIVGSEGSGIARFEDGVWTEEFVSSDQSERVTAIVGRDWNDLFVATVRGRILHYDGSAWSVSVDSLGEVDDIAVGASGRVFVIADGRRLHRFDGTSWNVVGTSNFGFLGAVWAGTDDYAVAVGYQAVFRFDGSFFSSVRTTREIHRDVWGASDDDVYIAGDEGILHYDGQTFTRVGPIASYGRIMGTDADHVVAVESVVPAWRQDGYWHAGSQEALAYLDLAASLDGAIVRLTSEDGETLRLSFHRSGDASTR